MSTNSKLVSLLIAAALAVSIVTLPSTIASAAPMKTSTGRTCTILGTSRGDVLRGTNGADVICGLGGNDRILGNGSNDVIDGGSGNDYIDAGAGNDTLIGASGNDTLVGNSGSDAVSYADLTAANTPVHADLRIAGSQNTISDGLDNLVGLENVIGGAGNDSIQGNNSANVLSGGGGDDVLSAGGGNDAVNGGSGSDVLIGGTGNDSLVGGVGDDKLQGDAGADKLLADGGSDKCEFPSTDSIMDSSSSCESKAVRVTRLLAEIGETFRPYSPTNSDLCVVSNCGITVGAYCIISRVTSRVDNCVVWNGWGDGWWTGMTFAPGGTRWSNDPSRHGPYFPASDWIVIDRAKLPAWAMFIADPGSYLLGEGMPF